MLLRLRPRARSAAPQALPRLLAIAGALLACTALAGCGEDEPPPRAGPDTSATRGRGPAAVAPLSEEQKAAAVASRFAPKGPAPAQRTGPKAYEKPQAEEAAVVEEEKPRDYPAELLSAARGAESCVQPRVASAALPAEVLISLEALVLETGTIVTGAARAPVLTPEELECVKRRLESTRLPENVKDAPRRVNATLKLTFKAEQPAAAPAANAAPLAAPQAPAAKPASGY